MSFLDEMKRLKGVFDNRKEKREKRQKMDGNDMVGMKSVMVLLQDIFGKETNPTNDLKSRLIADIKEELATKKTLEEKLEYLNGDSFKSKAQDILKDPKLVEKASRYGEAAAKNNGNLDFKAIINARPRITAKTVKQTMKQVMKQR